MMEKTNPRKMFFSGMALWWLLRNIGDGAKVLDVGCGNGAHAATMREYGIDVVTIDNKPLNQLAVPEDRLKYFNAGQHIVDDFMRHGFKKKFDVVWCSHVLEHQVNPGMFIQRLVEFLKVGGLLVITVPPCKQEIVGGHVSLWNPALLVYHLVLAGVDCSEAVVQHYGYNITVAVKYKKAELPALTMDNGDIQKVAQFFPVPFEHGQDGWIASGSLE